MPPGSMEVVNAYLQYFYTGAAGQSVEPRGLLTAEGQVVLGKEIAHALRLGLLLERPLVKADYTLEPPTTQHMPERVLQVTVVERYVLECDAKHEAQRRLQGRRAHTFELVPGEGGTWHVADHQALDVDETLAEGIQARAALEPSQTRHDLSARQLRRLAREAALTPEERADRRRLLLAIGVAVAVVLAGVVGLALWQGPRTAMTEVSLHTGAVRETRSWLGWTWRERIETTELAAWVEAQRAPMPAQQRWELQYGMRRDWFGAPRLREPGPLAVLAAETLARVRLRGERAAGEGPKLLAEYYEILAAVAAAETPQSLREVSLRPEKSRLAQAMARLQALHDRLRP
jgi:hypothetical protein